ncbi:LLM class flavin-dependent oxidoreductase [Streptomyces sp. KLOTTS4A1]|uniref:LLM class flavin-dependent oxidoreductase n=1 Tax=Streptomyces sp. KLOTTS4A1 TaxID=3390996 RepID=UPI0039F4A694
MPVSVARFNLIDPEGSPAQLADRYGAALEMARFADSAGMTMIQTEEHHGVENNWLPSPFTFAAGVFGATRNIAVTISAILGPLHDPLRIAEEIAVLDLMGKGRLMTVAGIGYRPEEYEMFGVEWARRGKLQDRLLETLLKAWTGEPFTYEGRTVRVTPRPYTDPHPMLVVGGSSKPAARRAARLGLPFFPSAHLPDLETYYTEKLAEYGTEGWILMPGEETPLLHISEDPDRTWAEFGQHFLHEAWMYRSWQNKDIKSAVSSGAGTVEELRAEGVYRILTPEQCVAAADSTLGNLVLHPLCGGMPIDEGWRSLQLFTEQVLPHCKN